MDYSETLQYLFQRLPMYQRIGGAAYKADLENTLKMCELLGHPETKFRSVHVAGTNGKGTTSNLLASVLQEAGYKTGLYTSPHYTDFRERIRIDGKMIPEERVVDFVTRHKSALEAIDLSFFEMTVGLAFRYFAEEQVDIAVIEVGLGGRLDSTNVITPLVSVITNIGMDHMRFLGNTIPQIAAEKAGIIKPGVPVVIGETQKETSPVFVQKSNDSKSLISFADQNWKIETVENDKVCAKRKDSKGVELDFPLQGSYQKKNLVTTLETLYILNQTGTSIGNEAIRDGIAHVFTNTGFRGRWQVLGHKPLIICDSGHNREGIMQVVQNLDSMDYEKLHFVLGVVNDKSLDDILKLLPKQARYYFCKADIPRGLPAEELEKTAQAFGLEGSAFSTVKDAFENARQKASPQDLIFIGGSTFVVAEVLEGFGTRI